MPDLIVEDGTVVANANTYVDDIDCGLYLSGHPDQATWTAATTARRQWALIRAARYLEARYSGRWRGGAVEYSQSLSWPRSVFYGDYLWGSGVEPWVIPQQLKDAQCELAVRDIKLETGLLPDLQKKNYAESETIGPLSVSYAAGAPKMPKFPEIDHILAPLLEAGTTSVPILRG